MEKVNNIISKIKEQYNTLFINDTEPIESNNQEETFIKIIVDKIKSYKQTQTKKKQENTNTNKIYLNRDQAITITCLDNNLKKSMYNEAINNGFNYGIIEFNDFYTTLVKYHNELYWYVKVLDGKYGLKEEGRFKKGYFNEYSNIRCLINASSSKYIYINKYFDTSQIKMIDDEEFLNIIFKFK